MPVPNPPELPFGSVDTPATGSTLAGEVAITGWALDDSGVTGVDVYRSPLAGESTAVNGLVFIGAATLVAGARPDILASYPTYPGANRAGWGYTLLSNVLPNNGNAAFTLFVYVRTMDGAYILLGSKTVTFANAGSNRPFGTIDTPEQGQTLRGIITNFGWALTPQPNDIPFDGSTIDLYVDGAVRGHPTYNNFRSDIATLFPGYANSNGAVGYFKLDTTTLADGVHTIAWVVRDNAGNASGIGSRYFTVSNLTNAAPTLPTTLVFVPPVDYATNVSWCTVQLRRSVDAATASPVASRNLGKPAVVGGEISVDISTLVDPLPEGFYYAVVVSTGPGGSTPSSPSAVFSK